MSKFKSYILSLAITLLLGGGLTVLILAWLAGGGVLQAAPTATLYVDGATGDDGNDCLSAVTACQTVGAAVSKAANDDTIQIAAGTYQEHDIEISPG